MAAGIAEQAGQQNGQVFHLTQRPAQLFILNAQGGVALGHTQIFDPGAQGGQLLLLRPEQGRIGRGHLHGPGGHGLGHSHVGDDAVGKQLGVTVDKRKMSMADIKNFGTYTAEVKLYNGITAKLYVEVGE